jgi:L-threonylcarbamoyladenylate synthase
LNIFPANKSNIKKAAGIIKSGGIVAFPTETVYGLGADVFNPIAVGKIFEAKKRPFFDPLIVHIASLSGIEEIAEEFGSMEKKLAEKFWPGPLTFVLPKRGIVPDIVTSGLSTVAVRMPANEVALSLINEVRAPIAAPSANLFGHISPTKAEHVLYQLGENIDMILDGGRCGIGVESTIIKIENGQPFLLRHGGVPLEEIEKITGNVKQSISSVDSAGTGKVESPGQLPYHYSPVTPLVLVKDTGSVKIEKIKAGLLAFKRPEIDMPFKKIEILSETGNMKEAAANLFSCLNNLDSAGLDIIYAEIVPTTGLGMAIMDRLTKAAKRS